MRSIATDTHDFPSLRRDGKIYVDKTMYIHRLATDPNTKLSLADCAAEPFNKAAAETPQY